MRYLISLLFSLSFLIPTTHAQTGTAYGIKGGLTAATQTWNGSEREYMLAYNGSLTIESLNDDMSLRFFGQLGYSKKGSAIVSRAFVDPNTNQNYPRRVFRQPFEQANLIVGIKNMNPLADRMEWYYGIGLRLDYLLRYDLFFLNVDDFVNKITYGLSLAGGIEFQPEKSPIAFQLEAMFHQDLSNQIFYENILITNQWGQQSTQSARVINSALDVTLSMKFIRKIIWVDADDDTLLPYGKEFTKR